MKDFLVILVRKRYTVLNHVKKVNIYLCWKENQKSSKIIQMYLKGSISCLFRDFVFC